MLTIAGGILLAILVLVLLPFVIAAAPSALAFVCAAALLGVIALAYGSSGFIFLGALIAVAVVIRLAALGLRRVDWRRFRRAFAAPARRVVAPYRARFATWRLRSIGPNDPRHPDYLAWG